MKKITDKVSLIQILFVLVLFFAAGSIILQATLPDNYCRACGPLFKVHPMNTIYAYSPGVICGHEYYGPEVKYSKEEKKWIIPDEYLFDLNSGYRLTEEDTILNPDIYNLDYTPDLKIDGDRLYFDLLLLNNAGHSLKNVKFDVLADVTIKKNTDGAYGEYSRFDSDSWKETISAENIYENSSQEIRIYGPLLPVENSNSLYVELFLVYPKEVWTKSGELVLYDNNEYVPEKDVPDVYDSSGSFMEQSDYGRKIRIYGYYISSKEE